MNSIFYKSKSLFTGYYIDATTLNLIYIDNNKQVNLTEISENDFRIMLNFINSNQLTDGSFIIYIADHKISPSEDFYKIVKMSNVAILGISCDKLMELIPIFQERNIQVNNSLLFGQKSIVFNDSFDQNFFERIIDDTLNHGLNTNNEYLKYEIITTKIRQNVIGDFLHNKTEKTNTYIPSSNVYANMYIDIKRLFPDNYIFNCVIEEMAREINKMRALTQKKVILLGVSTNGTILAGILAYKLGIQFSFINKLGPEYTFTNIDTCFEPIRDACYICIADFLCLGSEYIRTKVLLQNYKNEVLGCLAVAKVEDVFRKKKSGELNSQIKTIVGNVNHLTESFEYKIAYLEEDL